MALDPAHRPPDLGPVRSRHRGSVLHVAGAVAGAVAALAVAVAMGVAVAAAPDKRLIGGVLVALMAAGGGVLSYLAWSIARTTVTVGERGIAWTRGATVLTLGWTEVERVEAVYERRGRRLLRLDEAPRRVRSLILCAADGRRMVLMSSLTDFQELAGVLRRRGLLAADDG